MNRSLFVAMAVCAVILGSVATSDAWLIDTTANVNTNSHNDSSTNVGERGTYMRNTYTNAYNQRYDNRKDESVHASGSFNDDHSVANSHNLLDSMNDYADKSNNSVNGSYNRGTTVGGEVRNSVMGDFNQLYSGTDFRSGVTGSSNTIDTSSVNITTLGDTLAK